MANKALQHKREERLLQNISVTTRVATMHLILFHSYMIILSDVVTAIAVHTQRSH